MKLSPALRWLPVLSIFASVAAPNAAIPPGTTPGAATQQVAERVVTEPTPSLQAENTSELRLDEALIEEFLKVIYFTDGGRFHFREYSTCSYEFIQNPSVRIEDGLVRVAAEYYSRRGSEALGGCVGGPGSSTTVTMSARLSATGSEMAFEVLEVRTESLPELTAMLLDLAGVKLPMTHRFDLMAALNRVLHENQSFGVFSLDIHDVLVEDESVRLRLTMQLGIW